MKTVISLAKEMKFLCLHTYKLYLAHTIRVHTCVMQEYKQKVKLFILYKVLKENLLLIISRNQESILKIVLL